MKRYLGLDLGSKTIGIAISESGIIAQALDTIRFKENHYEEAADLVIGYVNQYQIDTLILGLPKHMNNDIGIRGKISEDFKVLLNLRKDIDIILWDERLSTRSAVQAMIKGSQRRNVQKQKKDVMAAVVILQNYLDYKGAKL